MILITDSFSGWMLNSSNTMGEVNVAENTGPVTAALYQCLCFDHIKGGGLVQAAQADGYDLCSHRYGLRNRRLNN